MSYDNRDNNDLLDDPNKRVGEARGSLAALFRLLLVRLNIDGYKWAQRMRHYLDDPHNGIPNNSRDRSSARGNLNKELRKDDMTWRVFRKALNFLGATDIEFTVRLKWKNGDPVEATIKVKDGSRNREMEEPED